MKPIILIVVAAGLLTGCATRANSVAPTAVNSSDYYGMSCDKARSALSQVQIKQDDLSQKQNRAANLDAASVFLFALPLGSVFGADHKGELAQAKGEVIALRRYIETKCQN